MKIAVLAVQGAFAEHIDKLKKLGVDCVELRQASDLEQGFDGLILPGGESTVQGKLLRELHMFEPLKNRIRQGLPVFGTCAGLILLAQEISNDDHVYFGTLPVRVKRNAYGRQLGSFHAEQEFAGIGRVPMTFIRAPYIEAMFAAENDKTAVETHKEKNAGAIAGTHVEENAGQAAAAYTSENSIQSPQILASIDDRIVAVRCGNQIGVAFHPELDEDDRIHEMFLKMCSEYVKSVNE